MLHARRSVSTPTHASQIGLPWSPSVTPGSEAAGLPKLENHTDAGLMESKAAVYSQHEQHMPHNLRISINDSLPQFSDMATSAESESSSSGTATRPATHPSSDIAMLQMIAQKKRAKLMGMALLLIAGIHVGCAVGYFVADIPAGFLARGIAYGSVHGALAFLAGFAGVYALLHRRSMHWSYLVAGLACIAVALVTTSVMQSCLSGPYSNLFGHCSSASDSYALMVMVLIGILSCCLVLRTRQQLAWYVRLGLASAIAGSSVAAMVVMWALKHGGTTTNFVFMCVLLVATYAWLIFSGMREVVVIPLGGINPEIVSPVKMAAQAPPNFPVGVATKELAMTFEALAAKIVKPLREVSHAISALSADVQDCVTKDSSISSESRQVLDDDMKELVGLAVQLRQLIEAWNIQRAREYRKRLLRRVLAAVVAGTTPPAFNAVATPLTPAAPASEHIQLDAVVPHGSARHATSVPTDAKVAEVVHHVPDSSGTNWLVNTAAEHLIQHVKHPSPHYADVSAHAQTLPFELSSDPNLVAKAVQQTLLQRYATAHSPQSIVARVAGTPRMHHTMVSRAASNTPPPAEGLKGLLSPTKPPRPPRNVPEPANNSPAASATSASVNTASHHNKSMSPLSWSLSSDSNSSPSSSSGEYCSTCGELLSSGSESSSSSHSHRPAEAEHAIHTVPSTGAADLVGGQVDPQSNKAQTQHEADYSRPDDTYAFDYGFEHEYGHKYKKKNPQHAQHILTGKKRESTEKASSPDQSLSASLGVSSMAPTLIHGRITDASAVILGVPSEHDLVAAAQIQPPAIIAAPGFASPMSDNAPHAVLSPQNEQNEQHEAQFHFGLHVLVVDDERVNRRIAERFLQQLGCTCTCAADGDEIVEALVVSERPFDVILLDVIMKRTNGIEVCKNLREQHVDIPIIAATANYSHKEAAIYRAAGFDRVLQKPFSMKDLASAVAQALGIQIGRGAALTYSKAP